MINQEETKKKIEEQFSVMMEAEGKLFKSIEDLRAIMADWKPENEEETKVMLGLAREIDGRTNFALRQILIRYGNLLFI